MIKPLSLYKKLKIMKLSEAKHKAHSEIKNIIFDWGGVITDLKFRECVAAFREIGFDFDWTLAGSENDDIFLPFETGRITPEEFRTRIRRHTGNAVTDRQIDYAWNLVLGDLPEERWRLLEKLKSRYRLFLLSNTNIIHLQYYSGYLMDKYGTNGYHHLFDGTYFSFELGMRKPDTDIFEHVVNNEKLVPGETLFIDDLPENIHTAEKLGLRVYLLREPETLNDLFGEA